MWKRSLAAAVGVIAVLVSPIPFAFVVQTGTFKNSTVSFWEAALWTLLACSMGFVALGIGLRFLRFTLSGKSTPSNKGWVQSLLLGVGFFFPAFIFSMPLTLVWANYTWPGDGQSAFAALPVSFCIGIAAAVICCIVLLKKRRAQRTP
jgi:uncharacterized membrane protein YidH (DUF202 family)